MKNKRTPRFTLFLQSAFAYDEILQNLWYKVFLLLIIMTILNVDVFL